MNIQEQEKSGYFPTVPCNGVSFLNVPHACINFQLMNIK